MTLSRTILLLTVASISLGAATLYAETVVQAEPIIRGAVTGDELAALANEVNLPAWAPWATSREVTSIEEGWVTLYSPRDPVGVARDWSTQLQAARALSSRASKAAQRHWLELFIRAGEAVGRRDAAQFASTLRALGSDSPAQQIALAANRDFFTAK